MKILHLIQRKQLRGAEIFASQLANHQIAQGHQVKLLAIFPGKAQLSFLGEIIMLSRPGSRRLFDVKGWRLLSQVIDEFNPDVIQANAGDTLKYAVFSKTLSGWKQPIVFRNASLVSLYIKNPLVKVFNEFLYRRTAAIASVSYQSGKDLNSLFPSTACKTGIIPIGIEHPDLSGRIEKQYFPTLIHVGSFSVEKNHEGLLNIFKKLLTHYPSARLLLLGDGPLRPKIEKKAKEQNIFEKMTFLGYLNNPMDYIRTADVLLLPSLIEGLPGVILEAQYCKTPVVANEVGGIPEVITSGRSGWLVKKGDEDAFVEAVRKVLQSTPEQLKAITEAAYNQVVEQYDNAKVAEKFIDLYRSVLSK